MVLCFVEGMHLDELRFHLQSLRSTFTYDEEGASLYLYEEATTYEGYRACIPRCHIACLVPMSASEAG